MGVVGKSPDQRRRVSVQAIFPEKDPSAMAATPSPQLAADYIAHMCAELVIMSKGANLVFVAHLLAMAQAEAEYVVDQVI
jgi:hypothetical protein